MNNYREKNMTSSTAVHRFAFLCMNIAVLWRPCISLDNGLAVTPPMGWISWQRFRCTVDCDLYPNECISEDLFKKTADCLSEEGYRDAGYEYLIIDDCWMAQNRTKEDELQADQKRFPHGLKYLSDYIHSKGLKFGLYAAYGSKTPNGYPGILDHMPEDAQSFAKWGVDYVKLGVTSKVSEMEMGSSKFVEYLNKTGRHMVYSCLWPANQIHAGMKVNYRSVVEHCNLWRNSMINTKDSYTSVKNVMDDSANKQDFWQQHAGPGHWNDPDMLIIGNSGLSLEQSKAQMAVWAILAAPLLMSMDCRIVRPEFKAILQNKEIIAVNQDKLGIQGRRIYHDTNNNIDVWARPIEPTAEGYHSYAITFVSHRSEGLPYVHSMKLKTIGLVNPNGYQIYDLYAEEVDESKVTILKPESLLVGRIPPTGAVFFKAVSLNEDVNFFVSKNK